MQLDRNDFDRPQAPWLVAVFTSATCASCADVLSKAAVLAADDVAVVEVGYQERPDLHARYAIDAVPALVLAGADGVVRAGFLGPVTATDLWAAVAEARDRPLELRSPLESATRRGPLDLREPTQFTPACRRRSS